MSWPPFALRIPLKGKTKTKVLVDGELQTKQSKSCQTCSTAAVKMRSAQTQQVKVKAFLLLCKLGDENGSKVQVVDAAVGRRLVPAPPCNRRRR